jgi:U3 small nucleolar RNA-associated protein 25
MRALYFSGCIGHIVPNVKHVLTRLECPSYAQMSKVKFDNFTNTIFPALFKTSFIRNHVCIVVPSYFDFLRVKKWIKSQGEKLLLPSDFSVKYISEYTKNSDISRARSDLFHGRTCLLIITERYYFFKRHRLRGIHHLVFYSPPVYPSFYSDTVNMLEESELPSGQETQVHMYYTKYDVISMERIVGSDNVRGLLEGRDVTVMDKYTK